MNQLFMLEYVSTYYLPLLAMRAVRTVSKTFIFAEQELRELTERKQFLLQNLTSNLKELEEIQVLADSKPDSLTGM